MGRTTHCFAPWNIMLTRYCICNSSAYDWPRLTVCSPKCPSDQRHVKTTGSTHINLCIPHTEAPCVASDHLLAGHFHLVLWHGAPAMVRNFVANPRLQFRRRVPEPASCDHSSIPLVWRAFSSATQQLYRAIRHSNQARCHLPPPRHKSSMR